MHQIEDIVGFFYASGGDVFASFLANFPNEMSRYPAMNPVNAFESNSYLEVFKFYLMAKYKNRFHVTHKIDVYNRVCVIVKCRMVRKADGSVSREGKKHECGLFEALEQFKRGVFDRLLDDILRIEYATHVEHIFGKYLEHWDASS